MTRTPGAETGLTYAVRVQGRLSSRWSAWFDGLDVVEADDGTTTVQGVVPDQAALHGLLQKVRDVGLPLLSVTRIDPDTTRGPNPHPTDPEGHDR